MSEPGQTNPSSQDEGQGPRRAGAAILLTKAHQPKVFKFPKRSFGQKTVVNQSFQAIWFTKWLWLHYVETNDKVLCIMCVQGSA